MADSAELNWAFRSKLHEARMLQRAIERDPLSHRAGSHERQVSEFLSALFDCVKALGDRVDKLHDDEGDD